jgi:HSP20 family molecular chaperone IbpA
MSKSKVGIHIDSFGIDINSEGQAITQTQTETSYLLRIRLDPSVKKETIKVRLVSPGLLEIEWPRVKGEEIPIE